MLDTADMNTKAIAVMFCAVGVNILSTLKGSPFAKLHVFHLEYIWWINQQLVKRALTLFFFIF
jgi:hypothetical protein